MSRKRKFIAIARRHESWWVASVPEINGVHTQARRLEQLPAKVLDAIHGVTDLPKSSIEVEIEWKLSRRDGVVVSAALAAMREAQEAAEESRDAVAKAASALAREGFSVRDIGHLLELSPQRISQILRVG
jgi:predicted RNase H-like HicB family nuclease